MCASGWPKRPEGHLGDGLERNSQPALSGYLRVPASSPLQLQSSLSPAVPPLGPCRHRMSRAGKSSDQPGHWRCDRRMQGPLACAARVRPGQCGWDCGWRCWLRCSCLCLYLCLSRCLCLAMAAALEALARGKKAPGSVAPEAGRYPPCARRAPVQQRAAQTGTWAVRARGLQCLLVGIARSVPVQPAEPAAQVAAIPPLAGSGCSQWQRSVLPPGARGPPLPQTHRRLAFFFSQVSCPRSLLRLPHHHPRGHCLLLFFPFPFLSCVFLFTSLS